MTSPTAQPHADLLRLVTALQRPESRARLALALGALNPDQRTVLQLLALHFLPLAPAQIAARLRPLAGVVPGEVGRRGEAAVSRVLDGLVRAGLALYPAEEAGRFCCEPRVLELSSRDAAAQGTLRPLVGQIAEMGPEGGRGFWGGERGPEALFQRLRLALYLGRVDEVRRQYGALVARYPLEEQAFPPLALVGANPPDPAWLRTLPPELGVLVQRDLAQWAGWTVTRCDPALFAPLSDAAPSPPAVEIYRGRPLVCWGPAWLELLRGNAGSAATMGASADSLAELAVAGSGLLLRGDPESAEEKLSAAVGMLRRTAGEAAALPALTEVLRILARIPRAEERPGALATCRHWEATGGPQTRLVFAQLRRLLALLGNETPGTEETEETWGDETSADPPGLQTLLLAHLRRWLDPEGASLTDLRLRQLRARAEAAGYGWVALEAADLLARLGDEEAGSTGKPGDRLRGRGFWPLADAAELAPPWERALQELARVGGSRGEPAPPEERLVWIVRHPAGAPWCELEPRVQRRAKGGGWTVGRARKASSLLADLANLALVRGVEVKSPLGELDQAACLRLARLDGLHHRDTTEELLEVLLMLKDHPYLYWESRPDQRVEVDEARPALRVARKEGWLKLTLTPSPWPEGAAGGGAPLRRLVLEEDGPNRLRVVRFDEHHLAAARILGQAGLRVPERAEEQALGAVNAVAPLFTVQSDIGGGEAEAEAVEADPRPIARCAPLEGGIQLELRVYPLGAGTGPRVRAGRGGATVVAEVEGKRLQTQRNLDEERRRLEAALAACPTLAEAPGEDHAWDLPEPRDALQVLLELGELGEQVQLLWPQGKPLQVRRPATLGQLSLRLTGDTDWFEASGELRLDEERALELRQLLDALDRAEGDFVPIGEGEYLALTRRLRLRLERLAAFGQARGKGLRLSPLAVPALEDVAEGLGGFEAGPRFGEQLRKVREAENLRPRVPGTLRATLRDYQRSGYQWLCRLAHWGAGACLADEMGLGKTVQALALILQRSRRGPALVVAPTSVCTNWQREAARFTPTLAVKSLRGTDRAAVLASLRPRDLLVTSYGLMTQELEGLSQVTFATVVLDEAQAIKNPATKRSRAAMKLCAEMKVITTGTPVENRLDELWTLFRFLNPGLLGGRRSFDRRFGRPIEVEGDPGARRRLRRLTGPFILRRTKDQVLEELPERTEVLRQLTMTSEEAELYEALRLKALDTLAAQRELDEGERRINALAQIMRLRRACCHPRLVVPGSRAPSAKLEALDEILDELAAGGHRALVFSQFVDYLTIVRRHLEQRQVPYQYLDGQTPAARRQGRVDAFQAGDGAVFLISLKAGGLGLNLTAADYVVHLDPWWNPMVEDQAADRAHRLGQKRPVTIYRLVLAGTIEERIVALHGRKRRVARDLLEGTDRAVKLNADALLELLRQE